MCLERLVSLKCSHFESYQMDKQGCKYQGGRKCPNYVQLKVREDKHRSCPSCKARGLAQVGIASFSLRQWKWWKKEQGHSLSNMPSLARICVVWYGGNTLIQPYVLLYEGFEASQTKISLIEDVRFWKMLGHEDFSIHCAGNTQHSLHQSHNICYTC